MKESEYLAEIANCKTKEQTALLIELAENDQDIDYNCLLKIISQSPSFNL